MITTRTPENTYESHSNIIFHVDDNTKNKTVTKMSHIGGKRKKNTLPEVNKKVSLIKYGYKLKKNKSSRQQSLNRATKQYGTLSVLRRVNLIRNYSIKNKKKHSTLTKDVEYLKSKYADEKEIVQRKKK